MLASSKADERGCDADDIRCLCLNKDFTYGLRDCSLAICNEEEVSQVLEYGLAVCSSSLLSSKSLETT